MEPQIRGTIGASYGGGFIVRECLGFNNNCYQSFQSAVNHANHRTWYGTS
jgi:hypothetical protein